MKTILTIAGHDPSGGAGILADIKTMSAFGCYGVAVVTSVTVQNTQGVFGSYHQSDASIREQAEALFADFAIDGAKTGMLPTANAIKVVADVLSEDRVANLVIDPVIRSTTGYDLIDDDALGMLVNRLLPIGSVVTPNAVEAERIAGVPVRDRGGMLRAAEIIKSFGAKAVLIKGGEIEPDSSTDLLLDVDGSTFFSIPRVRSRNTHGTGCTLAAALACLLSSGLTLRESIPVAKRYLAEGIRTAPGLGRGFGPLNHFPEPGRSPVR